MVFLYTILARFSINIFSVRINEKTRLFAGIACRSPAKGFHLAVLSAEGSVTDLVWLPGVQDILRYLRIVRPFAIAIDAPGRGGPPGSILLDAFPGVRLSRADPVAFQDRLLTEDAVLPLSLLQGQGLRAHRNMLLDAILCAMSARRTACSSEKANPPMPKSRRSESTLPLLLREAKDAGDPFREYSLCLVVEKTRILLGMKKRGLGKGYWNGFGGKIEPGETPLEGAARELEEEAGLSHPRLTPAGMLHFTFEDGTHPIRGFVFRVDGFTGKPQESEEMRPRWFPLSAIPYKRMWPDDPFWIPLLLEHRPFQASFHVGRDHIMQRRCLIQMPDVKRLFRTSGQGKSRRP